MPPETPPAAEERSWALGWTRRIELFTVVVASFAAVLGLWFTSVQSQNDRALAKEGQITDRYTAAVRNLGEETMGVRLGGIYALQRIMQDSHRDQPTIANVLAAYIRTHAAEPPTKGQGVPADVVAALSVLSTRDTSFDGTLRLDLHGAKLPGVELTVNGRASWDSELAFSGADLSGVDLSGAILIGADLSGAHLSGANLSGANLLHADLRHAFLLGADLSGANLNRADLSGASMSSSDPRLIPVDPPLPSADLSGADLSGADLRDVWNLERKQIDSALTNGHTRLPTRHS